MDEQYTYLLYSVFGVYSLLFLTAAATDLKKFIIPNAVVMALVALFFIAVLLLPFDTKWFSHLGAALAVFAVGAIGFYFKQFGAGDVKLLTAAALWGGFAGLPDLLLITALVGGALAIVLKFLPPLFFGVSAYVPFFGRFARSRLLTFGRNVPYGVAIAAGGIVMGMNLPHLGMYL